ncbi:MAG: peptidylprolyl isomerase [Thiomargarita sp.]|nr:peptidylprolyl isomerase [Thiomargarita sp.]
MNKLNLIIFGLLISIVAKAEVLDYIVTIVNDDVIVNSTLQQELKIALVEWQKRTKHLPLEKDLTKQVLNSLILAKLQLQLAKRMGIQVGDNLLNEKLQKVAREQNQTLAEFRLFIEKKGYNYVYAREKVREQMIIEKLQVRQILSRIDVSKREIDNFLSNKTQQGAIDDEYHLQHILIATSKSPLPAEIKSKQQKSNRIAAELKQGADFQAMALKVSDSSQAVEGGDLGWLKAGEMPTLFDDIVYNMKVAEIYGPIRDSSGFHIIKLVEKKGNKLSIITQTKARHILIKTNVLASDNEVQRLLKELKFRAEQGDDFADLARANSKDTTTAINGGSLDWVNPGNLVPEFEKIMDALAINEISQPFKTRYGWHIVQVLERRKHDNTKQALRVKAASRIRQRKIKAELESWLRQLRDQSYIKHILADSTS